MFIISCFTKKSGILKHKMRTPDINETSLQFQNFLCPEWIYISFRKSVSLWIDYQISDLVLSLT